MLLEASPARGAEPRSYEVDATLLDGEILEVRWSASVRVEEEEASIRLWVLADRLAVAPAAMDERSARWIFPGEQDLSTVRVRDVRVDGALARPRWRRRPVGTPRGRDAMGAELVVPITAAPAREVRLSLTMRYRLPGRFGRLGRVGDDISLTAPWYPLVVGDGGQVWHRVPHRARLVAEDRPVRLGLASGEGEAEVASETWVPARVGGEARTRCARVEGTEVCVATLRRRSRPPPSSTRGVEGLIDLAHVDVLGLIDEEVSAVLATLEAFGRPRPPRVTIWEVSSRTELAARAPGVLLLSDRAFQIFPLEEVRAFHRRAFRRALFAHLSEASAVPEGPDERGWATDIRAEAWLELHAARARGAGARSPAELLELFAFHPAVDQLLYAPQIAFEDVYFGSSRDLYRDDPLRARRSLASGRALLESIRDRLDESAFGELLEALLAAERPIGELLAERGDGLEERLYEQLHAPEAPLNYRLGELGSEALGGGRHRHRIEVFRDGATRREPVEIELVDEAGHREVVVWDEEGPRGEVTLETGAPLASVTIDPRHRRAQSAALADGHPRRDDATDHPYRPPILNGFLFDAFVTEGLFTGLVDFVLRRRYDLEHTIGLRLERTVAQTGGSLRYAHGLGPKVHTNRRMGFASTALTFQRLHEGFADRDLGGWRAQVGVSGGVNTLAFLPDPREGFWLSGGLTAGASVRDDESFGWSLRGAVRGGVVLPLGLINALVLVGGGGFSAGEVLPSELSQLGGRSVLRGFESGELIGRGVLYAVAEHRLTLVRDLAMNLAHLVWVREVQLAAFAGAGVVFETLGGDEAIFAGEVGGGVRFHFEYGGVQPGVLALDVGVPLTRESDQVIDPTGMLIRRRAPVGFYISFDQFF